MKEEIKDEDKKDKDDKEEKKEEVKEDKKEKKEDKTKKESKPKEDKKEEKEEDKEAEEVKEVKKETKKKTKTKTKTVDEEEEKPKPDGDIVEKSFEPIGSLSSEAKPVSEAQAWMVLHDVLDRVFRQMGEPLTSGDHTTFKRHVFEPHWELIGPNRWKDRVEELATVAQLAKGSKNIKACFMSEQKRKYLGSPNEDALKGL